MSHDTWSCFRYHYRGQISTKRSLNIVKRLFFLKSLPRHRRRHHAVKTRVSTLSETSMEYDRIEPGPGISHTPAKLNSNNSQFHLRHGISGGCRIASRSDFAALILSSLFGLTQHNLLDVLDPDKLQPRNLFVEYGTDHNNTGLMIEVTKGFLIHYIWAFLRSQNTRLRLVVKQRARFWRARVSPMPQTCPDDLVSEFSPSHCTNCD